MAVSAATLAINRLLIPVQEPRPAPSHIGTAALPLDSLLQEQDVDPPARTERSEQGVAVDSDVSPAEAPVLTPRPDHRDARAEALALFAMVGRNGDTVRSIRELIEVGREDQEWLRLFVAAFPEEREWVLQALELRRRILKEFDRLVVGAEVGHQAETKAVPHEGPPKSTLCVAA